MVLGAQQPTALAQQPSANPISQSFRTVGAHYGGWLLAAFDSIPATKYRYKPTRAQQRVGYVAQHLEEANYEQCVHFAPLKAPAEVGDSLVPDSVKATWPKDTLVARLKASLVFCDSAMATMDDASLADQVPAYPLNSGRKITRARYLLAFVTDLAEHYSQIASYMRLNGMVPPSALPHPNR
jgi:hypothetical protein